MNMLGDMGVAPTTPTSGLIVDPAGAPVIIEPHACRERDHVSLAASVSVTLDRTLDPSTVN